MVVLTVAMLGVGLTAGCKTHLAEGGVYQGDTFLYQAENTINTAHDTFRDFLVWEKQYRDILPVEVSRAADQIRMNEQKWIASANALHDAYVRTPTAENKDKLALTLNLIQAAFHESLAYMVANKSKAPNNGLKGVQPVLSASPGAPPPVP